MHFWLWNKNLKKFTNKKLIGISQLQYCIVFSEVIKILKERIFYDDKENITEVNFFIRWSFKKWLFY